MAATNAVATTSRAITDNLETGIWYVNGTNSTDLYSQSDGAAYVNKYSDSWISEIYQDYRTGQIALRGKNNGTWQAWRKVLDSSNYTDWTVTKTGTGASGTWGISITGNAATATKLATARNLGVALGSTTAVTFDGSANQTSIPISGTLAIAHGGTGATTAADARTNLGLGSIATETATNYLKWQTTTAASTALYDFGVYINANNAAGTGMTGGNYFQIINIPYRKASGNTKADWGFQIGNTTSNDGRLWYRTSGDNVWGDWQTIAHATQSTTNTGSATQPVYMTAAGVITAGTALKDLAYIDKPSSNQTTTFLRGDGTWQAANNYSLPLAANGTRGGVQIGYTASGKNYPVQLSSEKMYVNVPWTDTTYSNFVKSGSTAAAGLVPSPGTTAGVERYLNEDGTWKNVYESFLSWGGKNFSASYGPLDAAMVDPLGANRFAFLKAAGLTIEYSTDGGSNWADYGATNAQKVGLFSNGCNFYLGKHTSNGSSTVNDQLRVTIDTGAAQIYTTLNKIVIYMSTSGNTTQIKIEKALQSTPTTYSTHLDWTGISGWSGWNILNINNITTYGNTAGSQYGRIRFTFKQSAVNSGSYAAASINRIMGFGGMGWTVPSNMAKDGHLYSYDADQNATFPATITATSFSGPLTGNATSATKANYLQLYEARGTTTTLNKAANYVAAGALFHLIASSSTSTTDNGKPPMGDANVLQMNWDNNGGYDAQLAISTQANRMEFRDQISTKKAWREVVTSTPGTATGSSTQPVYISTTGVATACTSYADASVASAGKLTTARNLGVALGSTTAVTFDGSANQTSIPVSGTLAIANGGTGETTGLRALNNLGAFYIRTSGVTIPNGANIDTGDYLTPGTYYSPESTVSATLTGNVPFTTAGFKLYVGKGYGESRIKQFVTCVNSAHIIYRMSENTGSTWTKWYKIANIPSGSDNKTFAAIGSATKPVYATAEGTITPCTYTLGANVNYAVNASTAAGTANQLAYYSGANAISGAGGLRYYTGQSTASTPATYQRLHISGATYGNTAAELVSGVAGVLSWGDGGPQITFDTNSTPGGGQAGALIFTDHDTVATGASFSFVSNQGDWNVISKRFHATTGLTVGGQKPPANFAVNNGSSDPVTFTMGVAGNLFVRDSIHTNAQFISWRNAVGNGFTLSENGAQYIGLNLNVIGTTSAIGVGYISAGNTYGSGTAHNAYGIVRTYGTTANYYTQLTAGALTANLSLSGTEDRFTMPKLQILSEADIGGTTSSSPPFSVGSLTGTHIEMDGNEIIAKSNATTPANLFLQDSTGGAVYCNGTGGFYVQNGLLRVVNNSKTVTIGAQNTGFIHIYQGTSGEIPFIFNGTVATTTGDLGTSTYKFGNGYFSGCIYGRHVLNTSAPSSPVIGEMWVS